jgi:hypothetical protein
MALEPVVLDTDTLSELSRGNAVVRARAAAYLAEFGRLTITAITVFERPALVFVSSIGRWFRRRWPVVLTAAPDRQIEPAYRF